VYEKKQQVVQNRHGYWEMLGQSVCTQKKSKYVAIGQKKLSASWRFPGGSWAQGLAEVCTFPRISALYHICVTVMGIFAKDI